VKKRAKRDSVHQCESPGCGLFAYVRYVIDESRKWLCPSCAVEYRDYGLDVRPVPGRQ